MPYLYILILGLRFGKMFSIDLHRARRQCHTLYQ